MELVELLGAGLRMFYVSGIHWDRLAGTRRAPTNFADAITEYRADDYSPGGAHRWLV
jgi:hypothetical protein